MNFCYLNADGTMKVAHQITKSVSIQEKTSALDRYLYIALPTFPLQHNFVT